MIPPRVTVLMTVYNGLPYLPQAIESLLAQTFTDLEFLILDDASSDGSVACIEGYRDPRIRLVRNERNLGQAATLNKGLALARAPWIARLDQDDVCHPDRLARQVGVLTCRPEVAAVGSWVQYINARGRRTGLAGIPINSRGAFLSVLLTEATPAGHTTMMFRRDAALAVGGYEVSFAPCEDYALWCRLALRRFGLVVIPRPLMQMRIHAQQQSQQRFALQQQQMRRAHEALVSGCAGGPSAALTALLRMDQAAWSALPLEQQRATTAQLESLLSRMAREWPLSALDLRDMRLRLSWWLSRGACLELLEQRWSSSRLLYQAAWRCGGLRLLRVPAAWCYPALVGLSPLFRPALRRAVLGWLAAFGKLRYAARLAAAGARR